MESLLNNLRNYFPQIRAYRELAKAQFLNLARCIDPLNTIQDEEKTLLTRVVPKAIYDYLFNDNLGPTHNHQLKNIALKEGVKKALKTLTKVQHVDLMDQEESLAYLSYVYQAIGPFELELNPSEENFPQNHIAHFDSANNIIRIGPTIKFILHSYYHTIVHEATHKMSCESVATVDEITGALQGLCDMVQINFPGNLNTYGERFYSVWNAFEDLLHSFLRLNSTLQNARNGRYLRYKFEIIQHVRRIPWLSERVNQAIQ
jgi:hypothetical protein